MAMTGQIWNDLNKNGSFDAGEPPMVGVTVRVTGLRDNVVSSGVTDAGGNYSLDDSGMTVGNPYTWQTLIGAEWYHTIYAGNPYTFTLTQYNEVRHGAFFLYDKRITTSSWVSRVSYLQNAGGVRVTFKDRKRRVNVLYPNTTTSDYTSLVNAVSKGRWIHSYYAHIRPYMIWP